MTRLNRRLHPVAVATGVAAGLGSGGSVSTSRPASVHQPNGACATRESAPACCTGDSSGTNSRPLVVGLAGYTASGKSTLCNAIVQRQGRDAVAVVTLDDFWMEESHLPRLPDDWLAKNPNMARLKQHDTNIPESVNWAAAEAHIREVITCAISSRTGLIIIEGFLLFSQPQLIALLDRTVYLTVDDAEKEILMMRKYRRSGHLGKLSYESRGITVEEYTRYWDECIIDRFQKYGSRRPPGTIDLPCTMATAEQVERLAIEIPLPTPTDQL